MAKKDMLALQVKIDSKSLLEGLAMGIDLTMSEKLTTETDNFIAKAGHIAQNVLEHIGECLKDIAENRRLCLFFANELGVLPEMSKDDPKKHHGSIEDLDEKLKELTEDKDVPDEVKQFLSGLAMMAKAVQSKKDKQE